MGWAERLAKTRGQAEPIRGDNNHVTDVGLKAKGDLPVEGRPDWMAACSQLPPFLCGQYSGGRRDEEQMSRTKSATKMLQQSGLHFPVCLPHLSRHRAWKRPLFGSKHATETGMSLTTAPSRGCYKPVPLRWPFLVTHMAFLTSAIAAVVLLQTMMPDSDNSAFVDGQHVPRVRRALPGTIERRQTPSDGRGWNDTSQMVLSCVAHGPSPTTDTGLCLTTVVVGVSVSAPGWRPSTVSKKKFPPQEILVPNTSSLPSDMTDDGVFTDPRARESTEYLPLDVGPTAVATAPNYEPTRLKGNMAEIARGSITPTPSTPETYTIVATLGGSPTTVRTTQPPKTTTILKTFESTVETVLVTFPVTTVVATTNGFTVTSVFTPPPQTVLRTLDSSVVTIVQTLPAETKAATVGDLLVTLVAVVTPNAVLEQPTTETVVSMVDGTTTTFTRVATPLQPITTAFLTTLNGQPTTIPLTLTPFTTVFTTTIDGTPRTMSFTLTPTPTVTANTESGVPNDNSTGADHDASNSGTRRYPGITSTQYFAGTLLPPLLAVLLAVPVSVIQLNVKLFQPFRALTTPGGATGADSVLLQYLGTDNVVMPLRQLLRGQPIPFLASLLLWLSWLVTPLAAEAIGFKVHGVCSHLSISGCAVAFGVSPWPAHALIAVLVTMLVLLVALAVLLRRWDTGVYFNPWSLAGMTLLSRNPHLRDQLVQTESEADLIDIVRRGRFHLEDSIVFAGTDKDEFNPNYGGFGTDLTVAPVIVPYWESPTPIPGDTVKAPASSRRHSPFPALTYSVRAIFIVVLLGLMALLCYYHLSHGDTPFELFMDSQTFGVKFLFAALGCLLAIFWSCVFLSLGALTPFRSLDASRPFSSSSRKRRLESEAVLNPPATNPYTGTYFAFRRGQWLLLGTALMALAGDLLPAFLANVPYSLTQTWDAHRLCTYAALTILGAMVVVLAASMCVRWPHMLVDPRSMAGMMYYVAGSDALLSDIVRMARADHWGKKLELEGRYFYARRGEPENGGRMVVDAAG